MDGWDVPESPRMGAACPGRFGPANSARAVRRSADVARSCTRLLEPPGPRLRDEAGWRLRSWRHRWPLPSPSAARRPPGALASGRPGHELPHARRPPGSARPAAWRSMLHNRLQPRGYIESVSAGFAYRALLAPRGRVLPARRAWPVAALCGLVTGASRSGPKRSWSSRRQDGTARALSRRAGASHRVAFRHRGQCMLYAPLPGATAWGGRRAADLAQLSRLASARFLMQRPGRVPRRSLRQV
jgi:hypothetical protein